MVHLIFIILLSNTYFLHAMDIIPLLPQKKERLGYDMIPKSWNIKRCIDIMDIPMRDICCSVENLSQKKQYVLKRALASSFTFNIAMLPKDLCLYILKCAYGDDDENQENGIAFFCEPMLRAIMLSKELNDNPIRIGNKQLGLGVYLRLSDQERNQLHLIANPSWAARFFEGKSDNVLSQEDHATVLQLLSDEIDQSQLVVLPSWWERIKMGLCGNYHVVSYGNRIFLIPFFIITQFPLAAGLIIAPYRTFPGDILFSIGVIIDIGIVCGGVLHGISRCRNYVVAQVQQQNNGAV